ncbi:MAG: hypothetical protein H6923_10140 [Alphaproteobacteria bacterium]|nr:hypothetical protein [Alphaproteobacteria bacterium]
MAQFPAAALVLLAFLALATGGWSNAFAASLLAILAILAALALLAAAPARESVLARPFPAYAAFFFCVTLLIVLTRPIFAASVSPDETYGAYVEAGKLIGLGAAFLIGLGAGQSRRAASLVGETTLAAGLVYGLWFVGTSLAGQTAESVATVLRAQPARLDATGALFALLALVALADMRRTLTSERLAGYRGRTLAPALLRELGLAGATFLVALAAIWVAASPDAGLALCVGAACLFALGAMRPAKQATTTSMRVVTALTVAVLLPLAIASAAGLLPFWSGAEHALLGGDRLLVAASHWRAFLEAPAFGHGLGTSEALAQRYLPQSSLNRLASIAVPGTWLIWLEETGLAGSLAVLAAVLPLLAGIAAAWRRVRREGFRLALALACALTLGLMGIGVPLFSTYPLALLCALFLGLVWRIAHPAAAALNRPEAREAGRPSPRSAP